MPQYKEGWVPTAPSYAPPEIALRWPMMPGWIPERARGPRAMPRRGTDLTKIPMGGRRPLFGATGVRDIPGMTNSSRRGLAGLQFGAPDPTGYVAPGDVTPQVYPTGRIPAPQVPFGMNLTSGLSRASLPGSEPPLSASAALRKALFSGGPATDTSAPNVMDIMREAGGYGSATSMADVSPETMALAQANIQRGIDQGGGVNNRFGALLGRIGEAPNELEPIGSYAGNPENIRRKYGAGARYIPGVGIRLGPVIGSPEAAAPVDDLAERQQMQLENTMMDRIRGRGAFETSQSFRDRVDERTYSGGDQGSTDRVALNRLRQGMRLNPQERASVERLAAASGGMDNLLSGSRMERKQLARANRLAAAQEKRAERQLRMALRKGTPPAVAVLNRTPTGSPLADILMYGSREAGALAGQNRNTASELANIAARGEQERMTQQQLIDAQLGAAAPTGDSLFTPQETTLITKMTPQEVMAEAAAKRWHPAKTRAALEMIQEPAQWADLLPPQLPQAAWTGLKTLVGTPFGARGTLTSPELVPPIPRDVRSLLQQVPPDKRLQLYRSLQAR